MQVSILEPKGTIWEGVAREVILPGDEGEMCVLDFHQPFLIKLRKGDIRCSVFGFRFSQARENRAPRTDNRFSIKYGIAFMKGNALRVFVET